MLRVLLVVVLASSCASAPTKPSANEPQATKAPVVATTAVPEKEAAGPTVLPIEPHGELGRGKCVDCFDCVDTVGFPPPGYRWACVKEKCEKAKLTGFTGLSQEKEEVVSNSEPAKRPAKSRKSRRRHN